MSKYGLAMRYYPPGVMGLDSHFVVEVTEWEARTPVSQHEIIMESVDEGEIGHIDPNDRQWMLLVLEQAAQIVENDMAKRDKGFISGTNAHGDLASETVTPKM
jgi:hypothetical protein